MGCSDRLLEDTLPPFAPIAADGSPRGQVLTHNRPSPDWLEARVFNALLLALAVVILLSLGRAYGPRYYTAWDDETLFVGIAEQFASTGVLGARAYAGNGLGMSERTYFMPPVYPLALGSWFAFVDPSLRSARSLSNAIGALCLVVVFLLTRQLAPQGILPGLSVLFLALDVHFASMYNWARPEILALTLSLLAVLVYVLGLQRSSGFMACLTISWSLAATGMLTHPMGGALGFVVIPVHLARARPAVYRRPLVWAVLLGVPFIALSLWGLYIAQDMQLFRYQFLEWQALRKTVRLPGITAYVGVAIQTLMNTGVIGSSLIAGGASSLLLVAVLLKALRDQEPGYSSFLVLLLILSSGLAVEYGQEMSYLPLRLPPFYIACALCLGPLVRLSPPRARPASRWLPGFGAARVLPLALIVALSASAVRAWGIVDEVRHSERAPAYEPATLAAGIIDGTDLGSSIGLRLYPDASDVIDHAHHFGRVRQLSWHRLTPLALAREVTANDYLAITDSVLDPRAPGARVDVSRWGCGIYRELAETYYVLLEEIVLPGGGKTLLYARDHTREVLAQDWPAPEGAIRTYYGC